jgi:hypothetical protein
LRAVAGTSGLRRHVDALQSVFRLRSSVILRHISETEINNSMRSKHLVIFSSIIIGIITQLPAQGWREVTANDNRAIIVVTGLTINEDPSNYGMDNRAGESAHVKLTARDGESWEKPTEAFKRPQGNEVIFYSADFPVVLDSIYTIAMKFKDGTTIIIEDFRLLNEWKRHFFYHSTIGTTSTASVLRKKQDEQTRQWCFIYCLFPFDSYQKLGGTQVKEITVN